MAKVARICSLRQNLSCGRLRIVQMCTVTFMPRRTGYCLAMNRDEKRTRPAGLPPAQRTIGGHGVIYPSEAGGGTWIALNDSGVSFALINWYSVAQRVSGGTL